MPTSPGPACAALHVTSNFTFLTGASHPEELVRRAAQLGYRAIAITDVNSMAGIVRAHVASKDVGIPLLVGCRLVFDVHTSESSHRRSLLVYATDLAAYGRLCRLLTLGKRRANKGQCDLDLEDVSAHSAGLLAVVLPPEPVGVETVLDGDFESFVRQLSGVFDGDRLSLAAPVLMGTNDRGWLARLRQLSDRLRVPLVATGDVHYHTPERRVLQDVLVCIRSGCTLDEAGFRLFPNGERYLKSRGELARLFAACPQALARSVEIAQRAVGFSLDELRYQYPEEVCPAGRTPMQHLRSLTWDGARERYPQGVPAKVARQIEYEFRLIDELDYAPYFLTVHDLVQFARSQGILCQGRGAAANSAVCYCLGVTSVDPERIDVLFERFISKERDEPPDIDVDFEHERREEVIQYIYARYGRERAALTAVVITYRSRSAVRDVGKVLGLSLDCIDHIAKSMGAWCGAVDGERFLAMGLDPDERSMQLLVQLSNEVRGFPRHLSQHVGGFVITRGPLCELVPIENAAMPERTVIEWDKDDIDAMGMLKVDVLGLGMLTCVRKALELLAVEARAAGTEALEFHTVPAEDPVVYDMLCRADTVGVFQIESRAQMSMLPRLRPRCFYDLVIEVAIVRPGPIQGNMVHPYLRRRNGEEPVDYPSDAIRGVLGKTLGVPLFQEQVMALAVVGAGFTPGRADQLRRAMAAWKRKSDQLEVLCGELMSGLVESGYSEAFAHRVFDQIKGFGEYGFPESHAASFALIVYVSAWLKCHHPAAFAAALLNSQPMGFYAPAQIVRDAQEHGVEIRAVDVNHSARDCTLEYGPDGCAAGGCESGDAGARAPALRLGMRMVKGLAAADASRVAECVREYGRFDDVEELHARSGVRALCLRHLAQADAFQSMGLDRQRALWSVRALRDGVQGNLWSRPQACAGTGRVPDLPQLSLFKHVQRDYAATRLSLKAHPLSFLRDELRTRGVLESAVLRDEQLTPDGQRVSTAGLVLGRQRPATASGVVFLTLEDETGIANLIVRAKIFERDREAAAHATVVLAHGRIERAQDVVHLLVTKIESLDAALGQLTVTSRDFH